MRYHASKRTRFTRRRFAMTALLASSALSGSTGTGAVADLEMGLLGLLEPLACGLVAIEVLVDDCDTGAGDCW